MLENIKSSYDFTLYHKGFRIYRQIFHTYLWARNNYTIRNTTKRAEFKLSHFGQYRQRGKPENRKGFL